MNHKHSLTSLSFVKPKQLKDPAIEDAWTNVWASISKTKEAVANLLKTIWHRKVKEPGVIELDEAETKPTASITFLGIIWTIGGIYAIVQVAIYIYIYLLINREQTKKEKIMKTKLLILAIVIMVVGMVSMATAAYALEGKKSAPGAVSPEFKKDIIPIETKGYDFFAARNPFRPPTEILPTECPPSMPLCKYDHSQIKLVGVIRAGNGMWKAFVENPDGQGYALSMGDTVGGGRLTVVQISPGGIVFVDGKDNSFVTIPMLAKKKHVENF